MSSSPSNPFGPDSPEPKPAESNPFGDNPSEPNPYQSPNFTDQPQGFGSTTKEGLNASILTQQRVVAILMIVQGTMSLLMGLLFFGIAVFVPALIEADMRRQGQPELEQMRMIMTITYSVMGVAGVIPGGLLIFAGIQNLRLRGHTLGLVALGMGALSIGTCYCFPTALALLIYGLIVYLHDTTKRAFALAKDGHTYDVIMQMAIERRY